MEEELKVIQLILTGSGSFSIAIAVSLLLLKRILNGLAADIARVERYLEDPLAEAILRGEFTGASGVQAKISGEKIVLSPTRKRTLKDK